MDDNETYKNQHFQNKYFGFNVFFELFEIDSKDKRQRLCLFVLDPFF